MDRDHPHADRAAEILALADAYVQGSLSAEMAERLEHLVLHDADACQWYVEYLQDSYHLHLLAAHALADEESDEQRGMGGSPPIEIEVDGGQWTAARSEGSDSGIHHSAFIIHHSPALYSPPFHGTIGFFSSGWPVAYLIATVICGVSLLIGSLVPVSQVAQVAEQSSLPSGSVVEPKMGPVGRITGMVDCQWEGSEFRVQGSEPVVSGQWSVASGQKQSESRFSSHQPLVTSHLVSLGDRFALASGLMEITYDTGAKVILQGPVTYEVESAAGGYLSLGKLTARLEKKGEKSPNLQISKSEISNPQSLVPNPLFVVRTPTATVTDLGTEFGVAVSNEGRTEVHVLQGVVETQATTVGGAAPAVQRVTEGLAVAIGPKTKGVTSVAFAPQSFVRKLQPAADTPAETAYISAVLADRPMGYWPLNEPGGARKFLDRSAHGIHGYAMGKPMAGQPGPLSDNSRALALDGHDYIDLGRHDEFGMKNDFTVEAWVWIGDVKRHGTVFAALGDGDHPPGWALCAGRIAPKSAKENPVVLRLTLARVAQIDLPLSASEEIAGRWLHVAVVYDRTNIAHLFIDGKHRKSAAGVGPSLATPAWLAIGCSEPGQSVESLDDASWRGRLAHVAVYPCSLSAQQIENHYRQGNSGGKEAADKQP